MRNRESERGKETWRKRERERRIIEGERVRDLSDAVHSVSLFL